MKTDIQTLELDTLLALFNQAQLIQMFSTCIKLNISLEKQKINLIENTFAFGENVDEIMQVDVQIKIIEKNLANLEIALLYKESEVFEHRIELEKIGQEIICLN